MNVVSLQEDLKRVGKECFDKYLDGKSFIAISKNSMGDYGFHSIQITTIEIIYMIEIFKNQLLNEGYEISTEEN